ncbi:hypothetical protein E2C01_014676 [Portunus trituberculatus]|uniref:Uncharacterized protein n=1 Tax=Portunus trituberculatus TaxID=210409 RepID=A0A5B7DKZ2_PORTR|nr:hypothetical protein [Portunus trituberculatus]
MMFPYLLKVNSKLWNVVASSSLTPCTGSAYVSVLQLSCCSGEREWWKHPICDTCGEIFQPVAVSCF